MSSTLALNFSENHKIFFVNKPITIMETTKPLSFLGNFHYFAKNPITIMENKNPMMEYLCFLIN